MKCCCCFPYSKRYINAWCPIKLPSVCQRHNQISPCESIPKTYQFLQITPGRNIRVTHIKPGTSQVDGVATRNIIFTSALCDENLDAGSLMSDSSLEDCFVKHWSKPCLQDIKPGSGYRIAPKRTEPMKKLGPQSKKDRALSKHTQNATKRNMSISMSRAEIEKFVDSVIREALSIALQETRDTRKLGSVKEGYTNLVFSSSTEDLNIDTVAVDKQNSNCSNINDNCDNSLCNETNVISSSESVEKERNSPPDLIKEESANGLTHYISTPRKVPQEKPILFFIHGVGGSSDVWITQMSYFVTIGFEVIAPDLLGHGFSSAPDSAKAYKFPRLLNDMLSVFDACIPSGKKCVIVGHSYGSAFATAIARKRSENVILLVLISSGGPTPLVPSRGIFSLPVWMMGCLKPFMFCGFRREAFYSPRGKCISFTQAYHIPPYVLHHIMQGQEWPEGDVMFHRRISIPTLLIYGLKDPFVTLVEECEMERTIPRSYLEVIPTAGHMVMLEAPKQTCHLIHKFIICWEQYLSQ